MSSVWSNTTAVVGSNPLAANGVGPKPGGGAVARFQSALSAGQPKQGTAQLGLSPGTASGVKAAASSSGGSSDSSASITANDFLTLLVTEMQNQDPTAQTDPNAYIDQLVQINSLEQLIAMNQNLALVLGTVTSPAPTGKVIPGASGSDALAGVGGVSASSRIDANNPTSALTHKTLRPSVPVTSTPQSAEPGNVGAASRSVARALDGHIPVTQRGHAIRDFPMH